MLIGMISDLHIDRHNKLTPKDYEQALVTVIKQQKLNYYLSLEMFQIIIS